MSLENPVKMADSKVAVIGAGPACRCISRRSHLPAVPASNLI